MAVSIFRELLWAEADRVGIGPALISVPGAINVADGGVDAEVGPITNLPTGGLLYSGFTRYQIKTGAFSAKNQSELRDLFLKDNVVKQAQKGGVKVKGGKNGRKVGKKPEQLKDRVRTCLDGKGTFVIVLFGSDTPDPTDEATRIACQEFLGEFDAKYKKADIRILRQNQIANFLNRHLTLAWQAQLKDFRGLRTHDEWGRTEIESLTGLKIGPEQRVFIEKIQSELRQAVVTHLCIWGEPGIGKTRLLFEATATNDLQPLIAYFRSPTAFEQSGVLDEVIRNTSIDGILVVDDCAARTQERIWSQLKGLGRRIRLLTVQHDSCESTGTTLALETPPLADEQIAEIIQQHGMIPQDIAKKFARYCGGSPRVADVIGWNLQHNPDDLTKPLDTGNLWNRYIEGLDPPSSEIVEQRKLVLTHLALFKRFGYEQQYENEAKAIWGKIEEADPSITWPKFQEMVVTLRRRRILQGEATLYITPRLLHIKLWCDWWELYGKFFSVEDFLKSIPDTLHGWLYEMFAYAQGSEAAIKAVRSILSKSGSFYKSGLIHTEVGANFFLSLVEADTKAGLQFLENTIGVESREQLLEFKEGRQRVVWSLEKIAVERSLFGRAARLLLQLAEAENNPGIANNATGTFAGLFSLGVGRTAPTQAPPSERFPVLEEALDSPSEAARAVALRACDQALTSGQHSRMYGAERRGLKDLDLWSPKTYAEWHEAYRQAWELLRARIPKLPKGEQAQAAEILLNHAFGLLRIEVLRDAVLKTIDDLIDVPEIPRKALLEAILNLQEYSQGLPDSVADHVRSLEKKIVGGDSFEARLRRLTTLPIWRVAPASDSASKPYEPIAAEGMENREELLSQLSWLTSSEAESAAAFGYELGKADKEFTLESAIVQAVQRAGEGGNFGLLGGYMRAMHEGDANHWLELIRSLSENADTKRLFPGIVMQSGLSDEAAEILTRLVKNREMPACYLQGFMFGGEIRNLSNSVFQEWIDLLTKDGEQTSAVAALRLLHHFILKDKLLVGLPASLYESVLLHDALFAKAGAANRDSHLDFDWSEVARAFLLEHPDRRLLFARRMLEGFGEDSILLARYVNNSTHGILGEITKALPSEVWKIVSTLLGPPIDLRAYSIKSWLRGDGVAYGGTYSQSVLDFIPQDAIWSWVDEDVEQRAWYIASFVPPQLFVEGERPCLAREILIRYGERDDVQRNLLANFSTEGWVGPESEHYQSKKDFLEHILEGEHNVRVREWLQRYLGYLRTSIDQARAAEEREDF